MKRILFLFLIVQQQLMAQTTCAVNINTSQVINTNSKLLLGLSFDGRSSVDSDPSPGITANGYYDPTTGNVITVTKWDSVPMCGARYPGNLEILNWNWSYTIGPFANRIAQPMGVNGTLSQKVRFGFDEFMTMTAVKGIQPADVQIMVNLYPSVGQTDPAILAADWVEYCNAPNDSSNPRGGIDWAARRATYGHPEPYGIKIWNIGNEPWSSAPGELGSLPSPGDTFIMKAIPIIDSMRSADPTIQITLPMVGDSSSNWNQKMLNSPTMLSRIWGYSPHAFYDEDISTGNPSVNQVQTFLRNVAIAASYRNKKVILGDHANNAPAGNVDRAVNGEGALATADLLIMASQLQNVERANYWIFGNTQTVWHPIRKTGSNYQSMAVVQLFKEFAKYFHEKSLSASVINAMNNAAVSNVRSSAFLANNDSVASVVLVNTHLSANHEAIIPVLGGFTLQRVKLLSAVSSSDTLSILYPLPLTNGNYVLPHTGILIFEYEINVPALKDTNLANPYANKQTKCIFQYLQGLSNNGNKKIVSGQMTNPSLPAQAAYDSMLTNLKTLTGVMPTIAGSDYMHAPSGVPTNMHATNLPLITHFKNGGLVALMTSFGNPWTLGASKDTTGTSAFDEVNTPGTVAYTNYRQMLDSVAAGLKELQDSGVTVLFRPLHEMNAVSNWWQAKGPPNTPLLPGQYRKLWSRTYHYLTDTHQLNNIIWVYAPSVRDKAVALTYFRDELYFYPGDSLVDIFGLDIYNDTLDIPNYRHIKARNKPLAIAEFGMTKSTVLNSPYSYNYLTLLQEVKTKYPDFIYWMSWNDFTNNGTLYFSPLHQNNAIELLTDTSVITLGELPVWDCNDTLLLGLSLPVDLIAFDVYVLENAALLKWETAIEINNERFEVERSANGVSFDKVGEVSGSGNSTYLHRYSFTDETAQAYARQHNQTSVYYRLKQIDLDGGFEFSDIRVAEFHNSNFLASLIFPNPAQGNMYLAYELNEAGDVDICVYDFNGRKILNLVDKHQTAGRHDLYLNTDQLATGVYLVRMNSGGTICKKLVKL